MNITGYKYSGPEDAHTTASLLRKVAGILASGVAGGLRERVFDLGCGNGAVAHRLTQEGYDVTGADPSSEGVAQARKAHPGLKIFQASSESDLAARFGAFPFVVSLEVIEHVYAPREFARCVYELLEPGGIAVISTPYHGYVKNVALALSGKLDDHFTALWDHGHIKFWSIDTLRTLLLETGFRDICFHRVGRIPILAKSMIASARR